MGEVFGLLDGVKSQAEAAQVSVLAEAMERGETTTAGSGRNPAGWALRHGPSYAAGGSTKLVRVSEATSSGLVEPLAKAVVAGRVPVGNADLCLSEMARLQDRLVPEAVPTVWDAYIALAESGGRREILALRKRLLAEYGASGELQAAQDRAKRHRALSQPFEDGGQFGADGVFEYRLLLDVEGKSGLEAALGPLSAPRPSDGASDLRTSDQRRADALIEICRRAVAAGSEVPTTTKAQLFITMDYASLADGVRGGCTIGGADAGALVAPDTVRRIACDASLIPAVLGADGAVLDFGRSRRLFTEAQTKAMWLRDGGCTFPGCSIPAQWCPAHHVWHWIDGGPTDHKANGALLCGYHHDLVHSRRLVAEVSPTGVVWDTRRGSYDLFLADKHSGDPPDP